MQTVLKLLKQEYQAEYGEYSEYKFNEQELARIDELYTIQSSWEWRFGRTPAFDYQLEERFSFGEMQFLFQIEGGLISDVAVFSDALDTELVQLVRNHMIGVRFNSKDISEMFEKDPSRPEYKEIAQYIAAIKF